MNWYIEVLKKYAVFEGRASRSEFWFFILFSGIASIICGFLDQLIFPTTGNPETAILPLTSIYILAIFLPFVGVSIRRLHDTGRSGWWLLLGLLPVIGLIVLFAFYVTDSESGTNEYGANPKILIN